MAVRFRARKIDDAQRIRAIVFVRNGHQWRNGGTRASADRERFQRDAWVKMPCRPDVEAAAQGELTTDGAHDEVDDHAELGYLVRRVAHVPAPAPALRHRRTLLGIRGDPGVARRGCREGVGKVRVAACPGEEGGRETLVGERNHEAVECAVPLAVGDWDGEVEEAEEGVGPVFDPRGLAFGGPHHNLCDERARRVEASQMDLWDACHARDGAPDHVVVLVALWVALWTDRVPVFAVEAHLVGCQQFLEGPPPCKPRIAFKVVNGQ